MKNKELITPIRTRGPIRALWGKVAEESPRSPARTRGGRSDRRVETRHGSQSKNGGQLSLIELVKELRDETGDLPCSAFVHGWGSSPSIEFLTGLLPLLRREDSLWLIPGGEAAKPSAPPKVEDAVVMNLKRAEDQKIYFNLIGDLVFFPAIEPGEVEQAKEWQERARVIITDSRGQQDGLIEADLIAHSYLRYYLSDLHLEDMRVFSPPTRYSKEEFARRGDEIYEREIRSLEESDKGKYVAIDIETGEYEIDADEVVAVDRLSARRPSAQIWLRRIGSRYVHSFGPRFREIKE